MDKKIQERLTQVASLAAAHRAEAARCVQEARSHEAELLRLQGEERALKALLPPSVKKS